MNIYVFCWVEMCTLLVTPLVTAQKSFERSMAFYKRWYGIPTPTTTDEIWERLLHPANDMHFGVITANMRPRLRLVR